MFACMYFCMCFCMHVCMFRLYVCMHVSGKSEIFADAVVLQTFCRRVCAHFFAYAHNILHTFCIRFAYVFAYVLHTFCIRVSIRIPCAFHTRAKFCIRGGARKIFFHTISFLFCIRFPYSAISPQRGDRVRKKVCKKKKTHTRPFRHRGVTKSAKARATSFAYVS